jgi:predicted dienelactone hydrolase
MVHIIHKLTILALITLLFSACQPVLPTPPQAASETTISVPHMPRFDAPTYGLRGPYTVGVRDFVIEAAEEGERSIPVSVWYPALNPDHVAELTTYTLDFDNPNFPDFSFSGRALRDAPVDTGNGPYPLVVYSHALTAFRQTSSFLTEHLASWGFVVIAGDHEDNWSGLMGESQRDNFVVRPRDVTRQIDFADSMAASGGTLAGLIDLEQVGVIGHSFGAEIALISGGARLNTSFFLNEWCATNPVDAISDCAAIAALLDKMVESAGLDATPEGLWPDWHDPRVDAIVPLAPGPQHFGADGLATVRVPTLLVESGLDWYAAAANAAYAPYTLLPDGPKTRLLFELGDHFLYLNDCATMPAQVEQGLGSFCADAVWDMARAHDLIDHFVTAFLLAELKGDATAAAALAPENVNFSGIQYETTAYATTVEFVALSEGEFTSVALADNLLGDPSTRRYAIYLPPSYVVGERRYPVVYVLHGFTGNQWSMLDFQEKIDAMIQNGDVPEMIVVMPDASNTYLGSFYMNSPTIGDYETYITSELVAWIDAHYRTLPQPQARGITGCSMGGLGAVRLGLQHPQVYGVVAGVSGPYVQAYHRMLERALAKIEDIPQSMTEMSAQPFEVQAIFALAAAAAPNPSSPPFYLEMPFVEVDGEIQAVAEVIERFGVVYANAIVADYPGADTSPQAILLYHGDQDPMADVEGVRLISTMLTEQGVDHTYLEVNGGGHCNLDYEPVIRFMAEHLYVEPAE